MNAHDVKEVIVAAGGTGRVAKEIGKTDAAISLWIRREKIPEEYILTVSRLTNWLITPHMINPSQYPYPEDALPAFVRNKLLSDCKSI